MTTTLLNQQGIAFSLEACISILGSALLFYLFLVQASHQAEIQQSYLTKWQNEQTAVFLTDSLVKNRNETAPHLGSAHKDVTKHRILPHELDESLLGQVAQSQVQSPIFFTRIRISFFNGETQTILDQNKMEQNCATVERVVRVRNQKALLGTVVCHA